jgi:hypothetical protein
MTAVSDPVALITAALVAKLNGAAFSLSFTATAPDYLDPEETDTDLYVAVFPREDNAESWWTTDTDRSDVELAILIRQRLDVYAAETVAALRALAREIRNAVRNWHPLGNIGEYDVNLRQIRHAPLWDPHELRAQQLFLSILSIHYQTEYDAPAIPDVEDDGEGD